MVGIGVKSRRRGNYLRFDLGKLNRAFQDVTRARENKRQEQERETESGEEEL